MTNYRSQSLTSNPIISGELDNTASEDTPCDGLPVNDVNKGRSGGTNREPSPAMPLLNTLISLVPNSNNSPLTTSLSTSNSSSSDNGVIGNQSTMTPAPISFPNTVDPPIAWNWQTPSTTLPESNEALYQWHPRPYSNGKYDPRAPKNYSPHDSIESKHNWARREYKVLTEINKREGIVALTLRFHCELTKQEYALLLSQLRKELQKKSIEWIAFADVTTAGYGVLANRLHLHVAFDTDLSPEEMGQEFRAACERAFYRLVRRSDFQTDAEYQATVSRRYRKHKTIFLQCGDGKDFSITDKRKVTDNDGNWYQFVKYVLKYEKSEYGVDPVPQYYSDGDVNNGQPLVRLFWKYKRGSGTKSLPRLHYSPGWFVDGTHQEQIKRFQIEQRALALSFPPSDTSVAGYPILGQYDSRILPISPVRCLQDTSSGS